MKTAKEIIAIILIQKQFIFKSFNDERIFEVEDTLHEKDIKFATTSQTGNDWVVGVEGSSICRQYFKK